jgi:hypothetical protein
MGLDTTKAGQVIAAQMEALEKDFGDKDGYEIGAVVTIVEVSGPEGSHLRIRNNMGNPTLTLGVLRLAEDELIRAMRGGEMQ